MYVGSTHSNAVSPASDPLFGWTPPDYSWVPSLRYLLRRERVLRLLGTQPAGDLLEVGCGAGSLLVDLADRGFRCTGLETSAQAWARASASVAQSGREVAIQSSPGDWQGRFSHVVALDVLEHIEDDAAALATWAGWLAPGGALLLSVPAHAHRWGSGDVWAGHYRRYDREGLLDVLRAAGFAVVHAECYGFPLANLTELLGERHYRRALAQREREGLADREHGNALSGIDRSDYRSAFSLISSPVGRLSIRLSFWMQHATAGTDWGSGYVVSARRA